MHTCAGGRSTSKLAQIRISNNLLLRDVEELTGIPQGQISRYECGYVRELRENRDLTGIKKLCELYGISSVREFNTLLEEAYQLNKVKLPDTYNSYNKITQLEEQISEIDKEKDMSGTKDFDSSVPTEVAQTIVETQETAMEEPVQNDQLEETRKEEPMEKTQYTNEQIQELLKRLYTSLEYEDFMMILSLLPQDIKPN